ncbi:MAG: 50S ribosomal protein L14, partial [Clostridiales bacterium]|nr:50S ribosomal protein L14 [Clostridiales bacterium]
MISVETYLNVADNTGARRVKCFRVLGQQKTVARIGDLIKVSVREAQPGGMVKKGDVRLAVIVRVRK